MKIEAALLAAAAFAAVFSPAGLVSAEEGVSGKRGKKVTLDASRSIDPEGQPLKFEWKQVSGPVVVLYDAAGPRPYFQAEDPGIYVFMVRASDGEDVSAWKKVTVEVKGADRRPVAVAGRYRKVRVGRSFILDGRASRDPEGETLTFKWEQVKGPERLLGERGDGRASVRLRARRPGSFVFRLRVSDGKQWSDPAEVRIDVLPPNRPPQLAVEEDLEVLLPEPLIVNRKPVAVVKPGGAHGMGEWVVLDGSASYDLDGDALGFFWYQDAGPNVRELRQVKGMSIVRFRPEKPGEYRFRLVVSDGREDSEPVVVAHRVVSSNRPPQPVVKDDLTGRVAREVILDAAGSVDPDGDRLEFRWKQVSGPRIRDFIVFEDTNGARVAFTPREPGLYEIVLSVSDSHTDPVQKSVSVKVAPENLPPRLSGPERVLLEPGKTEVVPLQVIDPDGDEVALTHAVLSGTGLRIAGKGPLQVTAERAGECLVRFFLRDGKGGTARKDVLFRVIDPSSSPVLTVEGPESAGGFEPVQLAADLRGAEGKAVGWRWEKVSGPPLFLAPSCSNGPVLCVAAGPGMYRLRVEARLASGVRLESEKTLAVAGGSNVPPEDAQRDVVSSDVGKRVRAAAALISMGKEALRWIEGVSIEGASQETVRDVRALREFVIETFGGAAGGSPRFPSGGAGGR